MGATLTPHKHRALIYLGTSQASGAYIFRYVIRCTFRYVEACTVDFKYNELALSEFITNACTISCIYCTLDFWTNDSYIVFWLAKNTICFFPSRPNGTQPFDVTRNGKVLSMTTVKGDVYMEVYQQFTPWLYQQVRVYKDLALVQLQFTVGPIPVEWVDHTIDH